MLFRKKKAPEEIPAAEPVEDMFFRMDDIVKTHTMGDEDMMVLKHINLTIEEGEYLSVLGPSGSGKSTLMNIVGCLDVPTSGRYVLHGREIDALSEQELAEICIREIGFIFQNSQLLPRLDALKNVELPLIYAGVPPKERRSRAREMLERVGLGDRMHHYSNQLSGGQQQRVAIARALVTNPTLLLAAMLFAASFAVAEETAAPAMEIEFDGTVVSGVSRTVTSAVGGSVESVSARAGQLVTAGDVPATLRTEKVYAAQDGIVTAVFGAEGDSISEVADHYGAVVYTEPEEGCYTISVSTEKACESSDNLYVHVGESVYLKCTDGDHTGAGFVSTVSGSSYTVQAAGGDFEIGENGNVYRSEGYTAKSRIGRGSCQRGEDIAVGGGSSGSGAAGGDSAGSIVTMHVSPGDAVRKGDVLYETLCGEYPAYYCTGADIMADATGILGELNVNEADLPYINEGDSVTIHYNWDEGATECIGSVFSISHVAQSQQSGAQGDMGASTASAEAAYTAIIAFTPDETVSPDVTPVPEGLTLTIRYVTADGAAVAQDYVQYGLKEGDAYDVESPRVEGMIADQQHVTGVMGAENVEIVVTYTVGGFPGGSRPSGGMSGMTGEQQGTLVTPGEALSDIHTAGDGSMALYGSVVLTSDELAPLATVEGEALAISLLADGK